MSDSLLPLFLKKVCELEKFILIENDRTKLIKGITNLKKWLVTNRSLQEHRCCQAFLTYLYQSYGDDFKSRDAFISYLKYKVGYCEHKKLKTIELDAKCPHCNGAIKEKAYLKQFKVKSLSFAECSQKTHNLVFKMIQELALTKWGVEFDKWHEHWISNEGTNQ